MILTDEQRKQSALASFFASNFSIKDIDVCIGKGRANMDKMKLLLLNRSEFVPDT